RELVDSNLSFERKERLTSHVVDLFRSEGLDDKVKLLDSIHELYTVYYRLDNVSDSYYGSLVPYTGILRVFELLPFKDGMLLLGPASSRSNEPEQPVTQEKMYRAFTEHLDFNAIVGVRNVGELNATTRQGGSAMLINVSEALHSKKIAAVADEIKARFDKGGAKIALIAGPSSSGKTTFTKRLAIQLITNLLEPR
ncbi:MAG: nucleoside kinase, partial [Paramuribaculum sp.]|nr:nucleoside kinase [Paramuribaculum sp.]